MRFAWSGSFALAFLLGVAPVRADFRVFEENAPVRAPAAPAAPLVAPDVVADPPPVVAPPLRIERRCTVCEGAICEAVQPECAEGEVASVVGQCWGPCVPAAQCGQCEDVAVEVPEPATEPAPAVVAPPEPAPIAQPAEPAGEHRWLDITGFLQPGFIYREDGNEGVSRPPQDDAFYLQRARFGVRAQLFWWFRARIEVELAPTPTLQDGFLDVTPHPMLGFRIGQFIVPFLRAFSFNEVNLAFLDRPLYTPLGQDRTVIRYLAPRDIGAMFFGAFGDPSPSAHDPVLEYNVAAFVGRGPNVVVNADGVMLWAARLQLHVLGMPRGAAAESDLVRNETPRVGVAAAVYSNCDDRGNWNRGFTFDAELRWEGLYASAAFVWFRNGAADVGGIGFLAGSDPSNGTSNPSCRGAVRIAAPTPEDPLNERPLDFVSRGAHFQVQYALPHFDVDVIRDMDFELLARVDWVDPFAIYSEGDPLFGTGPEATMFQPSDYVDSDNGYERWRLTFGLNWFPTGDQTLRLGLNYFLQYETENVVGTTGTYRGIRNDTFWAQITAGL